MPVRRRLLLLAFSLLVPALLACGIAVLFAYSHERQRSEENLLRTTQALAESLDRELDSIVLRLEALATSPSLRHGDFEDFWQQSREAIRGEGMWVVLIARDGQQIVNTLRPFGEPLPHHERESTVGQVVERIFRKGTSSVSDLFLGPISRQPTLAIGAPVFDSAGQVIYTLFFGAFPGALQGLVLSTSLPEQWLAAAFDTRLVTVARSRDAENFVGKEPAPALAAAMRSSDAGIVDATSLEGIPSRVAFSRSPKYGWGFAIGVPRAELAAAVYQTILLFLGIALALLAGGAVLAVRIGRDLSHAITSLVPAAHGLGEGGRAACHQHTACQHTGVLEVDAVSSALVHAGDALRITEAERKRAEEAMRAAKERAEEILSSITDGFYTLDREWRFSYINSRAQQILGKTPDDVMGVRFFDVFPQVQGTSVHEQYADVMTRRQARQFDFISPILKRWTSFSVYPAGDGGIAVYFRDISAQKTAEAELVAAKEEAERASLAKSRFLASASHDLRQPVQSLFFFHEVLVSRLKDHPCGPVVARMGSGLDALKSLLDGLLDISRLHAGAIEIQTSVFPVSVLLDRLKNDFGAAAKAQGVSVRVVGSLAWARSDVTQLERILRNLVDNAIKHTGRGGKVVVGCRRSGDRLRVQVSDTGTGIPHDQLDAIFEEFVQLGNPERDRAKGLGLGLAIVRHLGLLLDHEVTVRSRLGHGTTFSVSVPMVSPCREDRPAPVRRQASNGGGLALVVDDEALVLLGLRSLLESWDWEVLAAGSGAEAVRLVSGSRRTPDIILADYRLRGDETGVKVIRDIHGVCAAAIPAVVLTGDTSPERIAECRRSGFRLLHKPVEAGALRAILLEMKGAVTAE